MQASRELAIAETQADFPEIEVSCTGDEEEWMQELIELERGLAGAGAIIGENGR